MLLFGVDKVELFFFWRGGGEIWVLKGLETILNCTQKHGDVATGSHSLHKSFRARLGDCSWVAVKELKVASIIKSI